MLHLQPVPTSAAVSLERVSKRFTIFRRRAAGLKERLIGVLRSQSEEREELWALRDVSLEIARGETLAVIGPNGCGKSTLLQIVAGILVPDGGSAAVSGRVTSLLELGAGFSPELSGRENVFLNAALHGVRHDVVATQFDDIVAFAELARFIDTPVRNYSSGMYMRLGFAVAVHLDPEIVLVDEAFAVGDENFQRKCLRKLKEFQDRGVTILFVSHDLLLVERIAARSCLLQAGRVAALGPTVDVIARYHQLAAEEGGVAGEYRWGNRDIEIVGVDTLDADGQPANVFRTGDHMIITMRFAAHRRVAKPVFGLAIYREDGVHLTGPNTRMGGYPIEAVEGSGEIHYRVAAVPFLPGRYVLSVSAYDYDLVTPYDHRERVGMFTIVEGGTQERFGLVQLPATWFLFKGGAPRPPGTQSSSVRASITR
jgi:ABC-type polysaccharide/polyol phosphate transport system ATPase subunit